MSERAETPGRITRLGPFAVTGVAILALVFALGQRGADGPGVLASWIWTLIEAWPAGLWLLAALGLGRIAGPWFVACPDDRTVAAPAIGVALLLGLDGGLGRLGLLEAAAWPVLAVPALAWIVLVMRDGGPARPTSRASWLVVPAAVPIAVLLVGAASAPGWLWASEFGGYDALSYHLQLPAEWFHEGRMRGGPHNVYGFLPSAVEAAYLHLMIVAGDPHEAAASCQLLHAACAGIAALTVGRIVRRAVAETSPARITVPIVTGTLLLGTPWVIVTGSLAYDEMFVVLMLAAALGLFASRSPDTPTPDTRLGPAATLGLLGATAVMAKASALGFVALPIVVLALTRALRRQAPFVRPVAGLALAGGVGLVVLAPWLIGNAIATGNPVFPFATSILGAGHWSSEQTARWAVAHGSTFEIAAIWREFLGYGFGSPPASGGPWSPHWSILPWLSLAAITLLALRRRIALADPMLVTLVLQIVFWFLFTHEKSRFLLPAIVPMVVLVGRALALLPPRTGVPAGAFAMLIAVAFSGALAGERGAQFTDGVNATALFNGDVVAREIAAIPSLGAIAPPAYWMNHALPDDARVLLVGDAAPFWYRRHNYVYSTTWDTPAGDAFRALVEGTNDGGFTHVLLDRTLLDVWTRSGWIDPQLEGDAPTRLSAVADPVHTFEGGKTLFEVRR